MPHPSHPPSLPLFHPQETNDIAYSSTNNPPTIPLAPQALIPADVSPALGKKREGGFGGKDVWRGWAVVCGGRYGRSRGREREREKEEIAKEESPKKRKYA